LGKNLYTLPNISLSAAGLAATALYMIDVTLLQMRFSFYWLHDVYNSVSCHCLRALALCTNFCSKTWSWICQITV